MMPQDISTHWNSTFDMVNFAIDYQLAIDAITGNCDMKMQSLELDAPEWTIAKELCETLKACVWIFHPSSSFHLIILQIFKHSTLFFSCNTPNISTVIPVMDHIDKHLLATSAWNMHYLAAICSALAIGKCTLNCYYNKTDHSENYRIAMGKLWYS